MAYIIANNGNGSWFLKPHFTNVGGAQFQIRCNSEVEAKRIHSEISGAPGLDVTPENYPNLFHEVGVILECRIYEYLGYN